jgi:predicted RNA binding protein YcfA (HicA-like mRNA interferase family)/predicted RNase H-like HicB family nuclease
MNDRFSALITKEDDLYVAPCPELNVTSQGTDVESARANLREAIDLYIETRGIPEAETPSQQPFWTFVEIAKQAVAKLPSISGELLVRALQRAGFVVLRRKGSHVSLEKRTSEKVPRTAVRQHPTLAKGTLSDVLKQAELTVNQLRELL